jgi:hypothetical protein
MSLASALGTPPTRRRDCKVKDIVDQLAPEDREILNRAWSTHSADAIAKALTEDGHPVAASTVTRHRLGRCSCAAR